jgi:hypothetical protein
VLLAGRLAAQALPAGCRNHSGCRCHSAPPVGCGQQQLVGGGLHGVCCWIGDAASPLTW